MMDIEQLASLLCEDLMNEYAHWHFYIQASTNVRGLHRQEISEFFLEQASGEMKHIEEFRRMIQGLITRRNLKLNVPNHPCNFAQGMSCPKALLDAALQMEDNVVRNYVIRKGQAESIADADLADMEDSIDATYIALFLEDQILDSRGDADNIREMIKNGIDSQ
jgi:ferritin-like protein